LPETTDEVCGVANLLGVDPRTHVYIGADAHEQTVKRLSEEGELAKYKIVHFTTHGVLAVELSPTAEPGLILTPPNKANEVDDGYASESPRSSSMPIGLFSDAVIPGPEKPRAPKLPSCVCILLTPDRARSCCRIGMSTSIRQSR
jgi:hypothetical protein